MANRDKPPMQVPLAHLDPDGQVTASWSTWAMIAGLIVYMTFMYVDLRTAVVTAQTNAAEIKVHREALIKSGILQISSGGLATPSNTPKATHP